MARTLILALCLSGAHAADHADADHPRHDLLGRFYRDIATFGGVEARLSASDADVVDLTNGVLAMPTLEEVRKQHHFEFKFELAQSTNLVSLASRHSSIRTS
jgi:hypothetical protein